MVITKVLKKTTGEDNKKTEMYAQYLLPRNLLTQAGL